MTGLGLGGLASSAPQGGGLGFDIDGLDGGVLGSSMTTDLSSNLGGLSLGGLGSLGGGHWDTFGNSSIQLSMPEENPPPRSGQRNGPPARAFGEDSDVDLNSIMGDFRAGAWKS